MTKYMTKFSKELSTSTERRLWTMRKISKTFLFIVIGVTIFLASFLLGTWIGDYNSRQSNEPRTTVVSQED